MAVIELSDELKKLMPLVYEVLKLENITSPEESVHLGKLFAGIGLMIPVVPHPNMYGPNSKEKAPKALAPAKIPVTEGGFYIFNVPKSRKQTYFWLFLMVGLAFFFLLFKVWPDWLRVGVWYVSFYLLVALVSIHPPLLHIFTCLKFLLLCISNLFLLLHRLAQPFSE